MTSHADGGYADPEGFSHARDQESGLKCPLCGGEATLDNFRRLIDGDSDSDRYHVIRCDPCGLWLYGRGETDEQLRERWESLND